jgi:polysaccharide biosynthesis protein PslG
VRKGKYSWEETDIAFQKIQELGIIPFVNLGNGHMAYTHLSTYDDPVLAEIYGYRAGPPTDNPEAMKGWLSFVKAVVNRYKGIIKYWEIWNEPNHRNYWGAEPNGKDYGILLKETATLIKEIDPEAIIIGGSMAGIDAMFARDFLQEGTAELIDIITYHHYASLPEERISHSYDLWDVINEYNPDIEIWQGECGYPSHSSTRDYRGTSPWGLNIQAKWLLRQAFTDIYFCKATLSNYFKLVHLGGRGEVQQRTMLRPLDSILGYPERDGARVRTWGVNEKCILSNPDMQPKPAYFAYQNLCAVVDKRYKPREIDFDIEITNQGMFYGIGEEDDAFPSVPLVTSFESENGNQLLAYWLPWHPQEYTPEPATVNIHFTNCKFRNPVLIDLLSGKVHRINSYTLKNGDILFMQIPLTDYPFLIAELEEINMI